MSCFHKIILTARAQPNIGTRAVQSPPGEVKIFQSFRSNNSHLSVSSVLRSDKYNLTRGQPALL